MSARIPRDLDLYPAVDHRQIEAIDVNYSVKVGYWASRNNVQEYKLYVTMIQMFDSTFVNDLQQVLGDNLWLAKPTNHNSKTCLLHQSKYLLGMNKPDQYSIEET
jgi:hypothetical protein